MDYKAWNIGMFEPQYSIEPNPQWESQDLQCCTDVFVIWEISNMFVIDPQSFHHAILATNTVNYDVGGPSNWLLQLSEMLVGYNT